MFGFRLAIACNERLSPTTRTQDVQPRKGLRPALNGGVPTLEKLMEERRAYSCAAELRERAKGAT
jgi:hypothetical protein